MGLFILNVSPGESGQIEARLNAGRHGYLNPTFCIGKPGAGEGIRTLDPNLGKVVLYP
jgi:hypothetical protein